VRPSADILLRKHKIIEGVEPRNLTDSLSSLRNMSLVEATRLFFLYIKELTKTLIKNRVVLVFKEET